MSTEATILPTDVADIVGDVEIPCFYHPLSKCGPAPARWVMHARCPECGYTVARLVCGPDKNILTSTEAGMVCESCGVVTMPARHVYYLIEWLA